MPRVPCEAWNSTVHPIGAFADSPHPSRTLKPQAANHDHRNPRRILGGQNPEATPSHRLQQRRGSAAPPVGNCLTPVILSEATASRSAKQPRSRRIPTRCNALSLDGIPPALSTARQNSLKQHSSVALLGILRLRCRSLRDRQLRSG